MIDMNYIFYMAEQGGLLPTKHGKMNAVINKIAADPYISSQNLVDYCHSIGLDIDTLSDKDIRYIQSEVNKRLP